MDDNKLPEMEFDKRLDADPSTRQLMLAILFDAIQNYLHSVGRSFKEAKHWIFQNDNSHVFSYVGVCTELGIDPGYLRKGIERKQGNSKRLSRRF